MENQEHVSNNCQTILKKFQNSIFLIKKLLLNSNLIIKNLIFHIFKYFFLIKYSLIKIEISIRVKI